MKPEAVYQIWAPEESVGSPWVVPGPFAQMVCLNPDPPNDISVLEHLANSFEHAPDLALIVRTLALARGRHMTGSVWNKRS